MGSKRSHERMNRLKGRFYDGMAKRGITGEIADADLGQARRVRELRVPREPLGVVRVPRLHLGVAQVPLPGRVLRGVAQRAADGVLVAAHARRRRAPARRDRAQRRHQRERRRKRRSRRTARCASASATCARSARTSRRRSTKDVRTRRSPTSSRGAGSRSRTPKRWRRPVRSRASSRRGARRCGRPAPRRAHGQGTLPGIVVGDDAPDLPEMTEIETAAADLWSTSMMPNGSPMEFVRPHARRDGACSPPKRSRRASTDAA